MNKGFRTTGQARCQIYHLLDLVPMLNCITVHGVLSSPDSFCQYLVYIPESDICSTANRFLELRQWPLSCMKNRIEASAWSDSTYTVQYHLVLDGTAPTIAYCDFAHLTQTTCQVRALCCYVTRTVSGIRCKQK